MKLHTASEVISFAKELENKSAKFYQDSCKKYAKDEESLLSFAKENNKNVLQIERAYYGVITDAIEGCFAFNIEADKYTFEAELVDHTSYSDALGKAIKIEEKIKKFYLDAAEQSKSLMADVPRNFMIIAKKRTNRGLKLSSLLAERG
jgi:hypothetical protein